MNQIERKFLDIQNSLHDIEYKFNDFNHLNSAIDQQAYKNLNDLTFSINRRNRILKEQLNRKIILSRLRPGRWYQATSSFVDNDDSDVEVVDVGPTVKFSDQNFEVNKSPKKRQKILIARPKNRQKATDSDHKKSSQKQKTASNNNTNNKIQTIRRPPTADLIRPSTGDILLTNSRKVIVHKHPNFSDGNFITQEIVHSVHRRLKSKERKKREKTSAQQNQNQIQKTNHEKSQSPKSISTQVSERRKKSVKKCIRESKNVDDHAAKFQEKIVRNQHNDVISKLKNRGSTNASEVVKKSGPRQLDEIYADKKIVPLVIPERNFSSPTFSSNQKIVEKPCSKKQPIQQRSRLPVRKNANNDHLPKNRRSLTDTNIILQKGKKSRIPIQNGHVSSKISIFENRNNNGESTMSVTSSSKTSTIPNKIPKNDQKVEKATNP